MGADGGARRAHPVEESALRLAFRVAASRSDRISTSRDLVSPHRLERAESEAHRPIAAVLDQRYMPEALHSGERRRVTDGRLGPLVQLRQQRDQGDIPILALGRQTGTRRLEDEHRREDLGEGYPLRLHQQTEHVRRAPGIRGVDDAVGLPQLAGELLAARRGGTLKVPQPKTPL